MVMNDERELRRKELRPSVSFRVVTLCDSSGVRERGRTTRASQSEFVGISFLFPSSSSILHISPATFEAYCRAALSRATVFVLNTIWYYQYSMRATEARIVEMK
jgi:hypothetical protein